MNREGFVIRRIFLLWLALLLAAAIGCAPLQTKSTGGQAETKSVSEGEKEILKVVAQREYLQGMLMGFADTFATRYVDAINVLLEQESSRKRIWAARTKFYIAASAFDIASSGYVGIGLLDMVVLVTLSRMVWEDYAQPEMYGDLALMVVKTLRESEEEAWDMAARILTPEELKELRALIYEWREKNPGPQGVAFIRFDNILELVGPDSLLQKETQSGGLFAPVTEATRAVDEVRFTAERAMYRLSRMQATLNFQIEMLYHDLATEPEIRQILSDIAGFRDTVERLPAQISEERENLMRDLESQEKTIRNVVGDILEMMKEGNSVIALVNETTKSVDSTASRIDSMLRTPSSGRPFDIMDYKNTVLAVSDTLVQAKSLLDEFDKLMISTDWEKRIPLLLKLADGVQAEVIEDSIADGFIYGAALILIFFMALFLTLLGYRYASIRLYKQH